MFGPIEANNNGQMVPQARSIWEGNDTNAAVARKSIQETELKVLGGLTKVCSEVKRAALSLKENYNA